MNYYSVNLPSYTIGEGCYKEIPHTTRFYGKTAVVIGGKIAMSKAKDKILEGILILSGMAVIPHMRMVMH